MIGSFNVAECPSCDGMTSANSQLRLKFVENLQLVFAGLGDDVIPGGNFPE